MANTIKWILALHLSAAVFVSSGCGAGGSTPVPPPPGPPSASSANLVVFVKDSPADNVLAFRVNVNSVSISDVAGKTTAIANNSQTLELRHLELAPTLVAQAASLPSGSYSSMTVTLASPQLTVTSGGNITQVTPQLTNSTVSISLNNFSLPGGGMGGVTLDFDLQNSISGSGSTYTVNPVIHAEMVNSSASFNVEVVDALGKVTNLPSTPANEFDFQVGSVSSASRVLTNNATIFDGGVNQFSNLAVGQYLEVGAQLQTDGTFTAKSITLSASNQSLRFEGIVTGLQQDTSGNVTGINMVAQN